MSPDIAAHSTLGLFLNVVAVRVLVSACEIPSISLVAELTRDYDERTALMRFRFLFGWLGGLAAVALAYGYFLKSDDPAQSGLLDPSGYAAFGLFGAALILVRSEEHTSELQSLMRNSYAVFFLKTKTTANI